MSDKVYAAATEILNLANSALNCKEDFEKFRKAALYLADDYVEDINSAFLLTPPKEWGHEFEELEDGSFKLKGVNYVFIIKQSEFIGWLTNIELNGTAIVLETKDQLIATVEWLDELDSSEPTEQEVHG